MIVSASYRTDIPAFYGAWFLNRLKAGYCLVTNPYSGVPYRVSLEAGDLDGFVFWTKNVGPFRPILAEVRNRGIPFVVQYAIDDYPRQLETAVVKSSRSVDHFKKIAADYGPRVAVWRYDPILFSSLTPQAFHEERFGRLAALLEGATDEVVISFAQIYRKTRINLDRAARVGTFTWEDPDADDKRRLTKTLAEIAASRGMQMTICSQPEFATAIDRSARCIDADRLASIARRNLRVRTKGNRPGCECHESRDIGSYDTCPHGCVYCYAVGSAALARERYRLHDPESEFLFAPKKS